MKNILIFGCSFSAGSYDLTTDRLIPQSKGWYHYVNHLKDKDVTVISISGDGYFAWYQLLLMLDDSNKLNYDEIWIQETYEPRVSLLNIKKLELEWNHPKNMKRIDNIKVFNSWGYGNLLSITRAPGTLNWHLKVLDTKNWKDHYNKKNIFFNEQFFSNIILKITELFQELCIKRNINGYVWSMRNPIMNCTNFTRLPLKYIFTELCNKKLTSEKGAGPHQTEEGNKYIGKLINDALL